LNRISPEQPLGVISLKSTESIKLALTVTNGGKGRRAHQVFLTLASEESGLEESFPLDVKENGKAKLDLVGLVNSFL
jgi:oligosaccharyltransferase complex subunit delta (ribophorin II)